MMIVGDITYRVTSIAPTPVYGYRLIGDGCMADIPRYVQQIVKYKVPEVLSSKHLHRVAYELQTDVCRHPLYTFRCALVRPCTACDRMIPCCRYTDPFVWFAATNPRIRYDNLDCARHAVCDALALSKHLFEYHGNHPGVALDEHLSRCDKTPEPLALPEWSAYGVCLTCIGDDDAL